MIGKSNRTLLSVGDEIIALGLEGKLNRAQISLYSSFNNVLNFTIEGSPFLLSVVNTNIGEGPYHLVLDLLPSTFDWSIFLDEINFISRGKIWSSRLQDQSLNLKQACANVENLRNFIKKYAPLESLAFLFDSEKENLFKGSFEKLVVEKFKEATCLMSSANSHSINFLKKAILMMRGCGVGLTPSGDDFISGFIWGLHLNEKKQSQALIPQIREWASSKNVYVNNFLHLSCAALINEKILTLFRVLEQNDFTSNLEILNWGATSGFDFATGLCFGIDFTIK
jgi:hypothetical protein